MEYVLQIVCHNYTLDFTDFYHFCQQRIAIVLFWLFDIYLVILHCFLQQIFLNQLDDYYRFTDYRSGAYRSFYRF